MTPQQADNANGFSIIEMLVVLAIIALSAAIALPGLTLWKAPTSQRLASAATQLTQTARLRAITSGTPTAVIIDITKSILRLEPGNELIKLPPGISVSAVVGKDMRTTVERGSIMFFANGGATGGKIAFTDASGHATELHVHWLTGAITGAADAD
jgi:general secretion pathway protein H